MDEKIKITIPNEILNMLKKDCMDFKVVKADGTPNLNSFINVLISNYNETFSASEKSLHDEIRNALYAVPVYMQERVFLDILKVLLRKSENADEKNSSTTLSFKPTKVSENARLYIEQTLLPSQSLSSYYRRLLCSYCQKPKNEREKVIFKTTLDVLQNAMARGVQVCMKYKSGEIHGGVSVYAIKSSKDELFNYVLASEKKHNFTVRLASIDTVVQISAFSDITQKSKDLFDRQIACAVQHPIQATDNQPIEVRLTKRGQQLFDKIYLYRPEPTKIDGDVYTFNCSRNQLVYYFQRFGEDALILSPKQVGTFMRDYYYHAYKAYRSLYH